MMLKKERYLISALLMTCGCSLVLDTDGYSVESEGSTEYKAPGSDTVLIAHVEIDTASDEGDDAGTPRDSSETMVHNSGSETDENVTDTASTETDTSIVSTDTAVPTDTQCTPAVYRQCESNNIYEYNSCGEKGDLVASCASCENGQDTDAVCVSCSGNQDPADNCHTCKPGYHNENDDQCGGCVRYVNPGAIGANNGLSWADGFVTLETALAENRAAIDNESDIETCQLWVREGTYIPDTSDRSASYTLLPDLHLFGSFKGDEKKLADRQVPDPPTTILSGDIGQKDVMDDNLYHVVIGAPRTTLDGFVITQGQGGGTGDDVHGGGMFINALSSTEAWGDVSVKNCRFENNRAGDGQDGIVATDDAPDDALGGHGGHGGALYANNVKLKMSNSAFINNSSGNGGDGGSVSMGDLFLLAGGGEGGAGGAIYVKDSELTLENSLVESNQSGIGGSGFGGGGGGHGGGIASTGLGGLTLIGTTFKLNRTGDCGSVFCSSSFGGGIYGESGFVYLQDSVISENETGSGSVASNCSGGGVYYSDATKVYISNTLFSHNRVGSMQTNDSETSLGCMGAGLSISNTDEVRIDGCRFFRNETESAGQNSNDSPDEVPESMGAGVMLDNVRSAWIANTQFTQNRTGSGSVDNDDVGIGGHGGGLGMEDVAEAKLVNCLFAQNSTGDGPYQSGNGAGLFYSGVGVLEVSQCTFFENTTGMLETRGFGGGMFVSDESAADVNVTNSIFWANRSGDETISEQQIWGEVTTSHSCVEGGNTYNGNTADDPLLTATYGISEGSSAQDSGSNDDVPMDFLDLDADLITDEFLPVDLAGNQRIVNGVVDMGAFEFVPD